MIPILYEASETAFTTQGIGALADAVSVTVFRALNGKDELTMVYPSEGAHYADLQNDKIVYAQPEYKKTAQPYQIYKITKPLNGLVTVNARHVGTMRPAYIPVTAFTASSITETLLKLPQNMAESNPFTFWSDKSTVANFSMTKPASLGNVLGGMEGSILDVYGGEYEFDGYTIKLWNRRGADNNVEIRYGKNITQIEQSEDFSAIITGVCPYWESMDGEVVVLSEAVVEGPYADTYSFRRTIVKDFTDQFEEKPTVAQLRQAALNYITQNNISVPDMNLSVSFEHLAQYTQYENMGLLETVNLGDTVHIYYEPLNVTTTARIVKTTYDCLNEKYNVVQIGKASSNLEQVMGQIKSSTTALKEAISKEVPTAIATAVSEATDLITGVNGGFVIMNTDANGKPYEILVMDADSTAAATNVLRINQYGIGFSTNGYNGPFDTAWTIDGNFVANYITTGTLTANLIKAGVLADEAGRFSLNLTSGELYIEDLSIISRKLDSIGGRNLIQGTLTPVVTPAENRPHIIGQTVNTVAQVNAVWSAADISSSGVKYGHGFRVTNTDARRPFIRFGSDAVATGSLNGLVTGWTYTMSGRCQFVQMSNYSGSDTYAMRVSLYTDAENPGSAFAASSYLDIYSITPSLAGATRAKKFAFTFTVPSAATMAYIVFRCTQTSDSAYGTSDYIDLRDVKLERGEVATGWTPAPEDQVGNDEIITKINATPESVLIQASRIDLQGSVSISSLTATAQAALVTGTTVKNQYYLSTSSSSATGGSWSDTEPTWSSGKYVWTRVATTKTFADGTSSTTNSTAVYDANLTTALSTASSAQTTASGAVASTVSVYYRSTTSTTPTISTSTTIGTSATTDNAWEYVMPRPKNGCYFYTCEKYTKQDGTVSFSTVRQMANLTYTSLWCSASDATYIDGASIYTGSVTADKITVSDLQALGATIGGWTINSTSISKDTTIDGETYHAFVSAPASPTSANRAFGVRKGSSTYPFQVTYDGKLKATGVDLTGTFNMTGGGVNISTSEDTTDVIQLNGATRSLLLQPSILKIAYASSPKRTIDVSPGLGVRLYDDNGSIFGLGMNGVISVGGTGNNGVDGNIRLFDSSSNKRVDISISGIAYQNASGTNTATYPSTGYPWGSLVSNGEETSDLDNCTDSGRYTFTNAAAHTPYSAGGVVDVYKNSSYMYQLAVSNNSSNDDVAYINIRKHNSSGWHEWQRIITPAQGLVTLNGNQATSYSTSGTTQTYTLDNGLYLVTTSRTNSTSTAQDGVWLVQSHTTSSHLTALLTPSGTTTVSISAGTLTLTTGSTNVRITITKLS